MKRIQTVGVIGAGIAGLACARMLHNSGIAVSVLEKSGGVGGRVATRRTDSGFTFDHGAQYFTARDEAFVEQVQQWLAAGTAALWQGRIVSLNQGLVADLNEPRERYVGVPGMNAISKWLATGLSVQINVTAQSLRRTGGGWQLKDAAGIQHGPYDLLISTAPPEQTRTLLAGLSAALDESMSTVGMAPCWAVLAQMGERLQIPFDAAFVHSSPLSWVARNSSKPEREGADCWVLHGSASWSREHLEELADRIAQTLVEEFWQATRQTAKPLQFLVAHRWRYALPQEPLLQRYLLDLNMNLGACGDWCGGPRIEGAFLSGLAMAKAVLEGISESHSRQVNLGGSGDLSS